MPWLLAHPKLNRSLQVVFEGDYHNSGLKQFFTPLVNQLPNGLCTSRLTSYVFDLAYPIEFRIQEHFFVGDRNAIVGNMSGRLVRDDPFRSFPIRGTSKCAISHPIIPTSSQFHANSHLLTSLIIIFLAMVVGSRLTEYSLIFPKSCHNEPVFQRTEDIPTASCFPFSSRIVAFFVSMRLNLFLMVASPRTFCFLQASLIEYTCVLIQWMGNGLVHWTVSSLGCFLFWKREIHVHRPSRAG